MPGSSFGMLRSSKRPPRSPSLTSSGKALDRPPAPTSWMKLIGFLSPSCQQRSMTSWQRRSISGFSRCTEAKSRSAELVPVAMEEAAPPPRPISIAGPPSTISLEPTTISPFLTCSSRMLPMPPASMIGLW
ncbi:hypothetical protein D3C85_1424650 [compost metagenome]